MTPEEQQKQNAALAAVAVPAIKWLGNNAGFLILALALVVASNNISQVTPTTKIQWQWPVTVKVQWPVVRVPVVPPTPSPVPPQPQPIPVPEPDPAPFVAPGLSVLIVEESNDRQKIAPEQLAAISGPVLRDWLNANCIVSSDGKTREWKIWDKDQDLTFASPMWQAAMKVPRQSVPWLVVSNGKAGFSGPLPVNQAAILDVLNKFKAGGN